MRSWPRFFVSAFSLFVLPGLSQLVSAQAVSVTTWHNDNLRTGDNLSEARTDPWNYRHGCNREFRPALLGIAGRPCLFSTIGLYRTHCARNLLPLRSLRGDGERHGLRAQWYAASHWRLPSNRVGLSSAKRPVSG
jgi:hypothetical protein